MQARRRLVFDRMSRCGSSAAAGARKRHVERTTRGIAPPGRRRPRHRFPPASSSSPGAQARCLTRSVPTSARPADAPAAPGRRRLGKRSWRWRPAHRGRRRPPGVRYGADRNWPSSTTRHPTCSTVSRSPTSRGQPVRGPPLRVELLTNRTAGGGATAPRRGPRDGLCDILGTHAASSRRASPSGRSASSSSTSSTASASSGGPP